jgi:PPOX class probable F420-dependent enzyme
MRALSDVRTMTAFDGKYLGLTTFKRDGRGVTTPVWFVPEDGRLLVETDADSYKVKRIRREPTVMVGLCSARGHMQDLPVTASAELLPDDQIPVVEALMARKYRMDMLFIMPFRAIQKALHLGRPRGRSVIVAITPSTS